MSRRIRRWPMTAAKPWNPRRPWYSYIDDLSRRRWCRRHHEGHPEWNKCFEAIGFSGDAIRVRPFPTPEEEVTRSSAPELPPQPYQLCPRSRAGRHPRAHSGRRPLRSGERSSARRSCLPQHDGKCCSRFFVFTAHADPRWCVVALHARQHSSTSRTIYMAHGTTVSACRTPT